MCLVTYICLFQLQLDTGLSVIGALYLCISIPYVVSSIVVGKLTDILVRILHTCYGPNVPCTVCDFT